MPKNVNKPVESCRKVCYTVTIQKKCEAICVKYDIFISYRRDGGEVTARILRDSLTERGYNVFFDVESLRSGAFNTEIYSVIDECQDFILVLSPNALDRCKNSDDWVRREVEYALQKKKNVIPILLRGFEFPADLPVTMKDLPYRSGLAANLEYYEAFLEKLETFLSSKKSFWKRIADFFKNLRGGVLLLTAAAVLIAGALGVFWLRSYPRTTREVSLTQSVVANVSYYLTNLDILADAQQDLLQAAEDYLLTGEESVRADRFAVCNNTFVNLDLTPFAPGDELLTALRESKFSGDDLQAMYSTLSSFRAECLDTMAYMEFIVSEECMLSDTEKLQTVKLYDQYLQETTQWFSYSANELLLPVTRDKYLEPFWEETLPYLGAIPLSARTWSRDADALVEAGNECYENMQDILADLAAILGNSNMDLHAMQEDLTADLQSHGYTRERAEKIVSYMGRDWEAELTESYLRQGYSEEDAAALARSEAALRERELDIMISFSPRLTDDMNTVWEKMTYLLALECYDEAQECIVLYQLHMNNAGGSDRYMLSLAMVMELKRADKLDCGIMVMEYYEADGINDQLMIGDVIYSLNGEYVRDTEDYLARKEALTGDTYTVKVLRLDEQKKVQELELTLDKDAPRVYLNDLIAQPE